MSETTQCNVPPAGWWCSREAGHDGPCAARPVNTECDGLCPHCGMDPLDRRGEGEWCPACAAPSLPSGSVEPMTETRYVVLLKEPTRHVRFGPHHFVRDAMVGMTPGQWSSMLPDGTLRYSAAKEWLDRIVELEDELARLRSSGGDEAGRRLREAAERVRMFLNHLIYVADKAGNVECRVPLDRVSEVEADLRGAIIKEGHDA